MNCATWWLCVTLLTFTLALPVALTPGPEEDLAETTAMFVKLFFTLASEQA